MSSFTFITSQKPLLRGGQVASVRPNPRAASLALSRSAHGSHSLRAHERACIDGINPTTADYPPTAWNNAKIVQPHLPHAPGLIADPALPPCHRRDGL
jgi:hypothetical protein